MRKAVALALVLALTVPTAAMAANPTRGMSSKTAKHAQQVAKKTVQASNKAAKATARQAATMPKFSKRVLKHSAVRQAVYTRIAAKLQANIGRVRSMAATVANTGVDVTGVVTELDQAQASLDLAKVKAAEMNGTLTAIAAAPDKATAQQMLKDAKLNGLATGKVFKDVRTHLDNAINALLALVPPVDEAPAPVVPPVAPAPAS